MFKRLLKKTFVYRLVQHSRFQRRMRQQVAHWKEAGRPVPPPPPVKQAIVRQFAKQFGTRTLVETGTFRGEMIHAMRRTFDNIYSIELDPVLFNEARVRFAKFSHITILQGDSGAVLSDLLKRIDEPCLFWLDGHWSDGPTARGSKETPIMEESLSILGHRCKGHVILIDDARCFTGEADYPTIAQLKDIYCGNRPDLAFDVADDIIRIVPNSVR